MAQSKSVRRAWTGACAAMIASTPLWPAGGLAQQAAPEAPATTVAPVVVAPAAPVTVVLPVVITPSDPTVIDWNAPINPSPPAICLTRIVVSPEYQDLRLSNVQAARMTVGGQPAVHVTGAIHNTRKRAIPVPPLWFGAINDAGATVKQQQAVVKTQSRIAAGGSYDFAFNLTALPQDVSRAMVTFAPQRTNNCNAPTAASLGTMASYAAMAQILAREPVGEVNPAGPGQPLR